MSAEQIALELDDRFHLLTGGARTVLPRQQTLAASIDWSHDRLDDAEKIVFRRLGVFAGPFPMEAAEAVVSAMGDVESVTVFDVVNRLMDKSLVLAEERADGAQHYRLLESLRAYALEQARLAHELDTLRTAHLTFWVDWLEAREPILHTDPVIEQVEHFHDCLTAALDWSVRDPEVGLHLLRRLGRPWQGSGRPHACLAAVDAMLTEENAERFPILWIAATLSVAILVSTARGGADMVALVVRAQAIAESADDEYWVALCDWLLGFTEDNSRRLRRLAHERDERYVECLATILQGMVVIETPNAVLTMLDNPDVRAAARESRYLRDAADRTAGRAALAVGDVGRCIEIAKGLGSTPSMRMTASAVRLMSEAGLLAGDDEAADAAAAIAEARLRRLPGTQDTADLVLHRRALLAGEPARVDPQVRPENLDARDPMPAGELFLVAREAIDAGEATLAVNAVRLQARDSPLGNAVLAVIEATAAQDEDRWHDALTIAGEHGLRLVAVDALEGLAEIAATGEAWAECLRLAAAAGRLRDETGYRWRFRLERERLDAATASATTALGSEAASSASAEGAAMDWSEAASYAGRARGERKRPSHGWAALTPTEQQVVALVADGLTNPQIAERLLMGRATVKTHLDHVFAKTGLHSRTELAAEYVRGSRTSG
jgi:DNA-binding CsgD family transcriptional regulator